MTTHNASSTVEYCAWKRIKLCCQNRKVPYYKKYGGNGISVCDEWDKSFIKFMEDMGPRPAHCNGIELIDPKIKQFCKINCRWAQKKCGRKQKKNKTPTIRSSQHKTSIGVAIETKQLEYIKRLALQRSMQEGKLIETNDLIRHAISTVFPLPKQLDMLEEENA